MTNSYMKGIEQQHKYRNADSKDDDFQKFKGIKAVFIQDEYDYTKRAWHWIRLLGISLVFTVVPQDSIKKIYPAEELPGVKFVSVLTGYSPSEISQTIPRPPSQRSLIVGYRGRPLSIRYGTLGQEKVKVGSLVRTYCEKQDIDVIFNIPCRPDPT